MTTLTNPNIYKISTVYRLLFLDIKMPQLNGFELLKLLKTQKFHVVFVTAYDQYALRAIKANALDYLLKPINTQDLRDAIERINTIKALFNPVFDENNELKQNLQGINLTNEFENAYQENISIKTIGKIVILNIREILSVSTSNYGAVFTLINNEKIISDMTLHDCEQILSPKYFIRCHLSHIISKLHIREINFTRTGVAIMRNNQEIPISARKKTIVIDFVK